MVPSCMREPSLFLVVSLLISVIHSWERTNISIIDRGRLINGLYKTAHSKMYIFREKATHLSNFQVLNGQNIILSIIFNTKAMCTYRH